MESVGLMVAKKERKKERRKKHKNFLFEKYQTFGLT
jgi:hypothetical protein